MAILAHKDWGKYRRKPHYTFEAWYPQWDTMVFRNFTKCTRLSVTRHYVPPQITITTWDTPPEPIVDLKLKFIETEVSDEYFQKHVSEMGSKVEVLKNIEFLVPFSEIILNSIQSDTIISGQITTDKISNHSFKPIGYTEGGVIKGWQTAYESIISAQEHMEKLYGNKSTPPKYEDLESQLGSYVRVSASSNHQWESKIYTEEIKRLGIVVVVQYVDDWKYEATISDNQPEGWDKPLGERAEEDWVAQRFWSWCKRRAQLIKQQHSVQNGQALHSHRELRKMVHYPPEILKKNAERIATGKGSFYTQDFMEEHQKPLSQMIVELNDSWQWTREQIADWLDTLDEQPVFHPRTANKIPSSSSVVRLEPAIRKEGSE